jgi:tRNA dimethylallyltransferase
MATARPTCPAVVGPTAVGKTALITRLAQKHALEVISLDSRQIYRGLRIGTAQPTADELAVCPHHLVDFVSPGEQYDAVRFRRDFERVYLEITARGGRPVLVGGAGLYLTALREGFLQIPGQSPERLAALRDELDELDDDEVRARLAAADPAAFARIHANDRYRSQRALEIFLLAGESMTSLTARQQSDPVLGLDFPAFVLARPVDELDARITARTALMLDAGWVAETEAALQEHPADCPGLQSIGYREIVQWLEGGMSREEMTAAIVLATRQYAKRQRTMFRHIGAVGAWGPEDANLADAIGRLLGKANSTD